jgi:excisionase family DNA binding protein
MEITKPFYSPRQVADIAGVHPSTILNYIAAGRLYAVKLSERTYRIPARAVLRLLAPEQLSGPTVRSGTDDAINQAVDEEIEATDLVGA